MGLCLLIYKNEIKNKKLIIVEPTLVVERDETITV